MTTGSILRGTWGFVRANVPAVAVWGVISLAVNLVARLASAPYRLQQARERAAGLAPSFAHLGPFLLSIVLTLLVLVVLNAAVFRAVLFPAERRAFYLRLGKDELRLLGLVVVLWLGAVLIGLVVVVALFVLTTIGGLTLRPTPSAAGLLAAALALALPIGIVFAAVRLSLAGPLTLARREIVIAEAWEATRGRFWALFGAYVVLWLGTVLLALVIALPVFAPLIAAATHPGDAAAQARLAALQATSMASPFAPANLLLLVAGGVGGALALALFGGAAAVATAQLLDRRAGLR